MSQVELPALTELKAIPQWVAWKWVTRDGKRTKPPINVHTGECAEADNPKTWSDFQTVTKAIGLHHYDGPGIVFTDSDPLSGIDLDDCRDPESGSIEPWAQDIIDSISSYTEISPSRTGAKIFLRGKLPHGVGNRIKYKTGKIEIYSRLRYFTVTGRHLGGTPTNINSRQKELELLHARLFSTNGNDTYHSAPQAFSPPCVIDDAELIRLAKSASNGASFTDLWTGDISDYDNDDSRADQALCCHLAFWTGKDPHSMDRLFRQSGLYRPKWEREDYRARTINRALERTSKTYTPAKPQTNGNHSTSTSQVQEEFPNDNDNQPHLVAVTLRQLLEHKFLPREPILGSWLVRQSLAMLYAWRGVGKTHFGLEVACAVAAGGEFLGWRAPKPRKALYIDGEMPGASLQHRLARIVAATDVEPPEHNLRIVTPDLQPAFMADLATLGGQAALTEVIEEDTELIILDSLSTLVRRGGRENEAESWLTVAEWALRQRATGRSVLFIHHAGKDGAQRGTSKREDCLNTVICLRRPPNYDPKNGAVFEVHFEKGRDIFGNDVEPIEASLTESPTGTRVWSTKPVSTSTKDRVIELANEGLTRSEIAEELGVNRSTVWRAWKQAVAEKKISEKGNQA